MIAKYMPNLKKVSGFGYTPLPLWGQVLLFAFTHTNAIYANALYCVRSSSFYIWEGERGKISYWG